MGQQLKSVLCVTASTADYTTHDVTAVTSEGWHKPWPLLRRFPGASEIKR